MIKINWWRLENFSDFLGRLSKSLLIENCNMPKSKGKKGDRWKYPVFQLNQKVYLDEKCIS